MLFSTRSGPETHGEQHFEDKDVTESMRHDNEQQAMLPSGIYEDFIPILKATSSDENRSVRSC